MTSSGISFTLLATTSSAALALLYYYLSQSEKAYAPTNHRRLTFQETSRAEAENDKNKSLSAPSRSDDAPPLLEINVETATHFRQMQRILKRGCITIVHASVTGTCSHFADQLYQQLLERSNRDDKHELNVQLASTDNFDWWDELLNDDDNATTNNSSTTTTTPAFLILLLPTYTNGVWSPNAESLKMALDEVEHDWRISKRPLKNKLQVAIFGMGSSEWGHETMGKPAKEALRSFQKLGAKCRTKIRIGDDAIGNHGPETFQQWSSQLVSTLDTIYGFTSSGSQQQQQQQEPGEPTNSSSQQEEIDYETEDEDNAEPEIMDLEEMGDHMASQQKESNDDNNNNGEPREMVTPKQAAALKKEGYKLIGTHSAVKMCRWTKHQLRGRGGCYKHTFYGITSYQCMEATPSLACANKCVFCWRHHKNPVGKEWRWKTDDPHFIVEEAVKTHVQMIKEAKGIPGVRMDRWQEALTVRHCALSLVGEPIMYPRIDELLADLHSRKISTFLVTNGQHPQAIADLRPITQLYVSVDAPTKESLIEIDRPLFNDAWDRLQQSLSSLKTKGQRTVARLTVVKGWNSDEIGGYAKLIALGRVSLVEVKGVTFCGKSDASNLNMSNTPWHHEVVQFTRILKEEIDELRKLAISGEGPPEYDFACEHKHSCSVLLARVDQFAVCDPTTGKRTWKTWIDYHKFHSLAARNAEDPSFTFSIEDYTEETPTWALFGADEEGFDPTDTRHRKATKYPKYTKFDENGVPTHDCSNNQLSEAERSRLTKMMKDKMIEIGSGSTVTELKGGAKEVADASLMYRGMVMAK